MCDKLDNLSKLKVEDLYDIFEEEFKAPPINITNILDKLEVEYNAVDFSQLTGNINGIKLPEQADLVMGAVAAFTEEDDGKDAVEITVNEKDTYHRQRFTLAHELGHCMTDAENLRNGFLELRTSVNTDESRERKANIVAGEILIPERLLRQEHAKIPFLSWLAMIFDVSENVMEARLKHLNMGYYKI